MTDLPAQIDKVQRRVERAARKVSPCIEHFARFGFTAKGITYLLLGFLAALTPIGMANLPSGRRGALETLLRQPAGWILLAIVALGLVAFGLWQIVRAVEDPEGEGTDATGVAKRIGYAANAAVQFALAAAAAGVTAGWRRAAADDEFRVRDWTGWAMTYPFGRWVVAGVGIGILIYGVMQVANGIRGKLDQRLALSTVSDAARQLLRSISRFGVALRGVVFALLGTFLMLAAWDINSREAHGLGGTLRAVAAQPYGKWLLGMTSLGLIAYGLYDLILARYRRITPP